MIVVMISQTNFINYKGKTMKIKLEGDFSLTSVASTNLFLIDFKPRLLSTVVLR